MHTAPREPAWHHEDVLQGIRVLRRQRIRSFDRLELLDTVLPQKAKLTHGEQLRLQKPGCTSTPSWLH